MKAIKFFLAGLPTFFAVHPISSAAKSIAPWVIEKDKTYSFLDNYKAPKNRKGLVVRGHAYDVDAPDWVSRDREKAAMKECNGKISYPFIEDLYAGEGPHESAYFPYFEFWFIHSAPDAFLLKRKASLASVEDCEAKIEYSYSVIRSFVSNDLVTIQSSSEKGSEVKTVKLEEGLREATSGMLPLPDIRALRKRYKGKAYIPEQSDLGRREQCFNTGGMLDLATQCHLVGTKYQGLELGSHAEHTSTYEHGDMITHLETDAAIDGRLFEWDRKIWYAGARSKYETHPEAKPYSEAATQSEVDSAIKAARRSAAVSDKHVIVILGANWCHDSRALAGWFETPRFAAMLHDKYKVVYVDAGTPQKQGQARNQHLIERFGGHPQENTPYVMILPPYGSKLLNRKDARSWRNAASRSEDEIYDYFANEGWKKE